MIMNQKFKYRVIRSFIGLAEIAILLMASYMWADGKWDINPAVIILILVIIGDTINKCASAK